MGKDAKVLTIISNDYDLMAERLKQCLNYAELYDEDYYGQLLHQHLEQAIFYYERLCETYADSDV